VKIGIVGAGAIGCYVGGRLRAKGADVVFWGRQRVKTELSTSGLTLVDGAGGAETAKVAAKDVSFVLEAGGLAGCDVALVCVKSAQSGEVARELAPVLPETALFVSMQNGLGNAAALRKELPRRTVLGGIVGFNVVWGEHGTFRRATSGPLVIESHADARVATLTAALRAADLETLVVDDIRPKQ
jgi:2-dehydropantoate 2-reductase